MEFEVFNLDGFINSGMELIFMNKESESFPFSFLFLIIRSSFPGQRHQYDLSENLWQKVKTTNYGLTTQNCKGICKYEW